MSDLADLMRKLTGQTKAYILVHEFLHGSVEMPQLKELMGHLATSDLERVGILELIRQELEARDVSPNQRDLLLGGLTGTGSPAGGAPPQAAPTPQSPPEAEQTTETPAGGSPRPPQPAPPPAPAAGKPQPPKPPPLYPGQGQRRRRTTGFIGRPGNAQAETTRPVKKEETFFGGGAGRLSGMAPAKEKPRVLVADDDPRIRMIFRMKLQKSGYEVREAQTGDEAWSMLEEQTFAAAILDMKMPGLHGLEILARLTSKGGELPVIVCSAYDQLKDEFVVANYPNLRYFVKPVDADELLAALLELAPLPDEEG
jgi:CheY-like chemotaxis protein